MARERQVSAVADTAEAPARKVRETREQAGFGGNVFRHVQVRELAADEAVPEGAEEVDPQTPCHGWHPA